MTYGNQCRHVQSPPQMTTAPSADPRFLFDSGTRTKTNWIQASKGNPLASIQSIGQHG